MRCIEVAVQRVAPGHSAGAISQNIVEIASALEQYVIGPAPTAPAKRARKSSRKAPEADNILG